MKKFIVLILIIYINFVFFSQTKSEDLPQGFAFAMFFPGTFYTWDTFGGTAEANIRTPYLAKFNPNFLPEIVFQEFKNENNTHKDLNNMAFCEWGGDNRDKSFSPLKRARIDLLDKWTFLYTGYLKKYHVKGQKETILISGFSHGNQTIIDMLNLLASYNVLSENTIYFAISKPQRWDHVLSQQTLNILGKKFINVYNLKDTVIGGTGPFDQSSKIDLFDMDGRPMFNKIYQPYTKDAINFTVDREVDFFGNHCVPLSEVKVLEQILNFFKSNFNILNKGEIYSVSFYEELNEVIIIPKEFDIYDFDKIKNVSIDNDKISDYYTLNIPYNMSFYEFRKLVGGILLNKEYYDIFNSNYYYSNDFRYFFVPSEINKEVFENQILTKTLSFDDESFIKSNYIQKDKSYKLTKSLDSKQLQRLQNILYFSGFYNSPEMERVERKICLGFNLASNYKFNSFTYQNKINYKDIPQKFDENDFNTYIIKKILEKEVKDKQFIENIFKTNKSLDYLQKETLYNILWYANISSEQNKIREILKSIDPKGLNKLKDEINFVKNFTGIKSLQDKKELVKIYVNFFNTIPEIKKVFGKEVILDLISKEVLEGKNYLNNIYSKQNGIYVLKSNLTKESLTILYGILNYIGYDFDKYRKEKVRKLWDKAKGDL
ncbi:MAG: hypothetical protein A2086_09410 [Spirochaetes bacterium GWD1_27_9]|nr:MAG: hypothetical protein A2Z98_06260 [Spirochaetes bacterium GWB1_27_13]OHD29798.1 MAG: hypothetical protein A2086_09410 [Spirochaetes bacterium GWD1_27_9]